MRSRKLLVMIVALALVLAAACAVPFCVAVLTEVLHAYRELENPLGEVPEGVNFHRRQAGTPGKDGWYEAKSTEGHFRVSLPIPFNDATYGEDGENAGIGYLIGSRNEEGFRFKAIEWVPSKWKDAEEQLRGYAGAIREKPGWTVTTERYYTDETHPALEIKARGPEAVTWTRLIMFPDRMFQLTIEYPVASDGEAGPYAEQFFDSLKIDAEAEMKGGRPRRGQTSGRDGTSR